MNHRKKVIILISAIVLCVIGISYYCFEFTKQTPIKTNKSKIQEGNKITKVSIIPKDRIKTIEGYKSVLFLSDDRMIYTENNELRVTDRNNNKVIKKFDNESGIEYMCSDGNYIVWKQDVVSSKTQNNISHVIKMVNIKNSNESIIDEDANNITDKGSDNSNYLLGNIIKIKDNKIIYDISYPNGINKIIGYDIESGKKSIIINIDCKKSESNVIRSFDIDINNGYMICNEEHFKRGDNVSNNNLLVLLDIKNNKQNVLLKASDERDISTSIEYPNVVFENKDTIHVYNIEKNKDDFVIKCNGNPHNVAIKDGLIIWNENKIYVYSIKDKKRYEIDNGWFKGSPEGEGHNMISGDIIHWMDYCKVRYIKMSDIKV